MLVDWVMPVVAPELMVLLGTAIDCPEERTAFLLLRVKTVGREISSNLLLFSNARRVGMRKSPMRP